MNRVVIHDVSGVQSLQLQPQRVQRKFRAHTKSYPTFVWMWLNLPNKTSHHICSRSALTPASASSSLGSHISCSVTALVGEALFSVIYSLLLWAYSLTCSLFHFPRTSLALWVCLFVSPWSLIETDAWPVQLAKLCFQWIYNLLIRSLLHASFSFFFLCLLPLCNTCSLSLLGHIYM